MLPLLTTYYHTKVKYKKKKMNEKKSNGVLKDFGIISNV